MKKTKIPRHLRPDLTRMLTLIEHHAQIKASLEAELARTIHTATGINILTEDVTLDPRTWEIERK